MKDNAKRVNIKKNNGVATITFFEHEYEMHKQAKAYKKIILGAAVLLVGSNLLWIIRTHR